MARRLTRDTRHAVLGGVASGFGRYLDVDPVLARLGFVLLAFVNGLGILFYLACWLLMPRADAVAPGQPAASASVRTKAGAAGTWPQSKILWTAARRSLNWQYLSAS